MRIILVGIQIAVLSLMVFVSVSVGGGLASLTALAGGYGPAAIGAGVYILMMFALALTGFVALVLPLSLLASANLLCGVLAGYRPLRWVRFLGVLANLLAVFAIVVPRFFLPDYPVGLMVFLLAYPIVNMALLAILPKRPNVRRTRIACRIAIPCLYGGVLALLVIVICVAKPEWKAPTYAILGGFVLLCGVPFYYAFRIVPRTRKPDLPLFYRVLALSAMAAVLLILFYPFGLPLAISWYLVVALAEMSLLYPGEYPEGRGGCYWLARTLGKLPDEAQVLGVRTNPRHDSRN